MTDVDPVLARVQPRWSDARTERNLAATFDRIARVRRAKLVGFGGVALFAAGAAAVVVLRAQPAERVAWQVAPAPIVEETVAAQGPRAAVAVPAANSARERAPADVKVTRVESKIASARVRFREQVARREYAAAYRSLVAAPGVVDQSAEGLMLAADAARLSGHPAEALPYLERLLREHARDERAPLAAFTMGRILLAQLARPAEAADAFARARKLAPQGPLAADALAREVEAAAGAGDAARARRTAQEYLAMYPGGARTAAVRLAGGLE